MKRRSTLQGDERSERGGNDHKKKKTTKQHPAPPVIGTVTTRTQQHTQVNPSRWKQPVSILINILSYADPETIRMLCCVSKQFYDLIYNDPGMENNRAVPLILVRPSASDDDIGRLDRLLKQLYFHRHKLRRHREVKIINGYKFRFTQSTWSLSINNEDMIFEWVVPEKFYLKQVVSLDMSSLAIEQLPHNMLGLLGKILPNVRNINLSNQKSTIYYDILNQVRNFSSLETITWNNIVHQSKISLDGFQLKDGKNLKEICMDDAVFCDYSDKLSDLENEQNSDRFLFHHCSSTVLERVSIQNARYGKEDNTTNLLPQNTLIKFVRKAPPSLRWFRSDLSSENMTMLRSERPEIELVN